MKIKIKAGIIGTGFIGPAHIEAVRRLEFVEVIALAQNGEESARIKAEQLGVPLAYGDYKDLLRNPDIEVVHNCTPNHLHNQINREIIEAGKHVLSEKPLAMSSSESAELLALARKHGVVHGVNFNYRQYPMMKQLAEMVKQEEFGRINAVHGSYLQDWLLYETDYNWRLDDKTGGRSRAIADIGSHWCDTVQYVTGKKIKQVFADLWTVHPIRKKPVSQAITFGVNKGEQISKYEDISVHTEDYASVLIRFDDGSKGAFTVSQVSAGRKNALSFELNGSRKSAYWKQEEPASLWIGHRDRFNEVLMADPALFLEEARPSIHHPGGHTEGWPDSVKNMMLQYYTFIREGKDPLKDKANFATFEDGHLSMCIMEAILKSHKDECWVQVQQ
ncbi:dehydrogenase [Paenibacillus sp. FSL A5-0031]|uniref:Gfo/Idh/MocA family protein n=1 Tax=Paenibacillus sp. FSL A5-0031 TaxID=1920420 RepID=UPI00096C0B6F|nr:Gfo/Idh/MocA family oxidoreductase [Paenibacillus sp. FSL A5-0031]OME87804.1 dehydrogenase [Paenibacillus sp. FSL A5-0031]